MSSSVLLLTCEHGGNLVPSSHRRLFLSNRARDALESHRGYDLGALTIARELQQLLQVPLIESQTTRLLVDLNRSIGHRSLFSEFSCVLSQKEREDVIAKHYAPHRAKVEDVVRQAAKRGKPVLHVAVHSFTPKLWEENRTADFALLYDPKRNTEKHLCAHWKEDLTCRGTGMRIRLNYPYRGNADGLTTSLRKCYESSQYAGVEIELNQGMLAARKPEPKVLASWIVGGLRNAMAQM